MINNHNVARAFLRNQLQTELIPDGVYEARAVRKIGGLFSYQLLRAIRGTT